MTDDIVTRLRERAVILFSNGADGNAFIDEQAANEIERLRAEVERLSSPLYPAGMNAIDKVKFLHEQIVKIVKGYND